MRGSRGDGRQGRWEAPGRVIEVRGRQQQGNHYSEGWGPFTSTLTL